MTLDLAGLSGSLTDDEARALAASDPGDRDTLSALMAAARARRDAHWGRQITFSPKVFLPLTNLCRNFCDYCSFRRSPGQPGEWTMSPDEVISWLDRGRAQGCVEALFCLGDRPEAVFRSYAARLDEWGFAGTVEYLHWAGERALERDLLPHTNAGVLDRRDMARLKEVNASLGLMLENVSPRLCQKGMPHHRAPDKRPERRTTMTREAGELAIAFTSGLLLGIGETRLERIETLLAIRDLHRRHRHIQEVIVQNFRAAAPAGGPAVPMAGAPDPDEGDIAWTVAVARLVLDDDIAVQAPPNLNPAAAELLLDAGINDFGGISPVTPDYINPGHPWPHIAALAEACAGAGYHLRPRPPIYPGFVDRAEFLAERVREPTRRAVARLAAIGDPARLTEPDRPRPGRGPAGRDGGPALESCLGQVSREARGILASCLEGKPLAWQDGVTLHGARGRDLHALCLVADHLRAEHAGDAVTYVVNRNINFTNVCVKKCGFCAFSRDLRSDQGYFLDTEEIVRRAREAHALGATEVCIQAGLAPTAEGHIYIDICRAVKAAVPELHVHAFSPEEVKYGALRARLSIRDYLAELIAAGLGSLPGTSAEILDDRMRERISPGRITTAQWIEVITTAHELGLPTTSTMMFGHVESAADRMRHMDLLRSIQADTGGFTEFVPLSFVHEEAPMFLDSSIPGVRPGPTGDDVIALYAVARLMLGAAFRNIQASWVKEGLRMTQWLLSCGVNDVGGTLMNESISTSAGARHGQLVTPAALRHAIRDAGRLPAERDTRYRIVRRFDGSGHESDERQPIDGACDGQFGSYAALIRDQRHRYRAGKITRKPAP